MEKKLFSEEKTDCELIFRDGKLSPVRKLVVGHKGRDLAFVHPFYAKGDYADMESMIRTSNFLPPTISEVVSLVHGLIYDPSNSYDRIIRFMMWRGGIWGSTGSLYLPDDGQEVSNGIIIQDHPEIRDGLPFVERDVLVKKLNEGDSDVRYVPRGLERDDYLYVRGLVGEEGVAKLNEIAEKLRTRVRVKGFDIPVNEPVMRVASLSFSLGVMGKRGLFVNNKNSKSKCFSSALYVD